MRIVIINPGEILNQRVPQKSTSLLEASAGVERRIKPRERESGTNTTQLFFPQDTIDTINTTISPYSAEGTNLTTNAADHVYSGEVDGGNILTLNGDTTNGYTATFKINLPITAL
jgi:hypothetical protein